DADGDKSSGKKSSKKPRKAGKKSSGDAGKPQKAAKDGPKSGDKSGEKAGGGQPAHAVRGAFAPQALNVVHMFNHYHLLLELPDHRIVDLDVPGDGSCFVHAAAWSETLAADWAHFCGNPHNLHASMATIREWFTGRLRALAPNEAQRMRALRVQ